MYCPSCGKENANESSSCISCGRDLPIRANTAAVPAPPPMFTQVASSKSNKAPILIAVVVVAVLGAVSPFAINTNRETPQQRIGRLMREAAGLQPVHNSFFASNRRLDDKVREQYRDLIHANQDYVGAVKNTDLSAVKQLNTPESFADPSSASEGIKQLHALYDLDMTQEKKVQEIVANIRHAFEDSLSSDSERRSFDQGFDQGIVRPLAQRQQAVAAEQAWVSAVDDVYGYAEQYHSVFTLRDSRLIITDHQVLEDFNSKVRAMNARRTEFRQVKHEFDQHQADLMQQMGVKGNDLGLK